jgi:hypothetical protein
MTYIVLRDITAEQVKEFIHDFSIAKLSGEHLFDVAKKTAFNSSAPFISATASDVDYVQAHCAFTRELNKCTAVYYAKSLKSDSWIISSKGRTYVGYIDDASVPALKAQVDVQVRIQQLQAAKKALGKTFGAWDGRQYVRLGPAPDIDGVEHGINAILKDLTAKTVGFSSFIQRNTDLFE